jgi:hypothetical protein
VSLRRPELPLNKEEEKSLALQVELDLMKLDAHRGSVRSKPSENDGQSRGNG